MQDIKHIQRVQSRSFEFKMTERPHSVERYIHYWYATTGRGEKKPEAGKGKQWGFVFRNGQNDTQIATSIAHEIGHGRWRFAHPFEMSGLTANDLAENLMNYSGGTQLTKLQWELISYPAWISNPFEGDEGGMSQIISNEKLYALMEEIRQSLKSGTKINTRQYITLSDNDITVGGDKYAFITVQRMKTAQLNFSIKDAQPELYSERNNWGEEQYCIGYLNRTITIVLKSKEERERLLSYLSDKRTSSFLLFISGYDYWDEIKEFLNKNENKNENETWIDNLVGFVKKTPVAYDSKEYWGSEFVDNFVSRLRPKKVTYMAGHDNIGTSNHKIVATFFISLTSSFNAHYNANQPLCFHNANCVTLNKTPNVQGFNQRRNNGKQRGADYVNQLKADCVKGADGLVQDTIDIVCHSMGFAHALGVIDVIKDAMKSDLKGLKLGRFYIIAPENACSGSVDVNDWQEVWQYGTDEANTKPWLQDGVAPQCKIEGMDEKEGKNGRAYIPDNVPQGFLKSHSIENYGWIVESTDTKRKV